MNRMWLTHPMTHRPLILFFITLPVFFVGFSPARAALSENRQQQFVKTCEAEWNQPFPGNEVDVNTLCRCLLDEVVHMDDDMTNEEMLNIAVGPVNMDARPDVFVNCMQPFFMKLIAKGPPGGEAGDMPEDDKVNPGEQKTDETDEDAK